MRFFTMFFLVTTNILLISIFFQLYTLNQQQKVVIQSLLPSPRVNVTLAVTPSVLAEHTSVPVPTHTPAFTPTPLPKGKQWYVDVQGNDTRSGLSSSTAFKTIQKAVDIAMPG